MKLREVSSQIFFNECEKILTRTVSRREESLRTSVSVLYRQSERSKKIGDHIKLCLQSYSEKDLLYYIALFWYLPEDLRGLFILELEEVIKHKTHYEVRDLFLNLLSAKNFALIFLLESQQYFKTTEEFFGWINQERQLDIKFIFQRDDKHIYNPINHSRIRGYRDKGSLGSSFIGDQEWKIDITNGEEEEERKKLLQLHKDTADLITGIIG